MGHRIAYPPCKTNPATDKPYTRHKWEILNRPLVKRGRNSEDVVHFYKVACMRCGFNDPNPPTH